MGLVRWVFLLAVLMQTVAGPTVRHEYIDFGV